jgi:hypothetical protein
MTDDPHDGTTFDTTGAGVTGGAWQAQSDPHAETSVSGTLPTWSDVRGILAPERMSAGWMTRAEAIIAGSLAEVDSPFAAGVFAEYRDEVARLTAEGVNLRKSYRLECGNEAAEQKRRIAAEVARDHEAAKVRVLAEWLLDIEQGYMVRSRIQDFDWKWGLDTDDEHHVAQVLAYADRIARERSTT